MKKTITVITVLLMLAALVAGCSQPVDVTPEVSVPEQTAEPTPSPEETPEETPAATPEQTPEETTDQTAEFPEITDDIKNYDDLVALLGKPDKEVKESKDKTTDLFYTKYNRVFKLGANDDDGAVLAELEGGILLGGLTTGDFILCDKTYGFESFGDISLGMTEKQIKNALGEPDSKISGDYTSGAEWVYDKIGAYIMMDSKALRFVFNEKFTGKTSCGIGIGSTKEDILSKYAVGMYPDDEINDNYIYIGNSSFGIRFCLTNGKVSEIFVGESSE